MSYAFYQNNNPMRRLSKSFIWFHRDSAFCFVGYKNKIKERNNHECIKIISSFQTLNCIVDCNVVDAQNDLK